MHDDDSREEEKLYESTSRSLSFPMSSCSDILPTTTHCPKTKAKEDLSRISLFCFYLFFSGKEKEEGPSKEDEDIG